MIFQTDWLSSNPVFYNEITGKASHNINDVIDFVNFEFHPEGFNNYLDFGYSVFEQTPVKHVRFLRHSSRLTTDKTGNLNVEYLDDPAEEWVGRVIKEKEVWELLEATVQSWEKQVVGEIIIPTSGGFDSRLLNFFIKDKKRIRSFTYGISDVQKQSYEVVYGKKLAELLGTQWQQIRLGNFHKYFDEWDHLYGPSTHAHGMYHLEFYSQVREKVHGQNHLLTGIIGDAWAGGKRWPPITTPSDVIALGLSHGIHANSQHSLLASDHSLRDHYFHREKDRLANPAWIIIESMRFKIILLSYLIRVPKYFGFSPWSPFLDIDIALSMLSLPLKRREGRAWQVDFLKKHGIYLEGMNLKCDYENSLNRYGTLSHSLKPLNTNILREVIHPRYIEWINQVVREIPEPNRIIQRMLNTPKVGGALRKIGVKPIDPFVRAYSSYLTLKPIENLLKRKEK